jgi:hypothetical protein
VPRGPPRDFSCSRAVRSRDCFAGLLFYLCNPPFVGYFYSIPMEGSYLIVNKNLVEVAALAVILVTDTGRAAGLDRIIHALIRRSARPVVV